MLQTSKSRSLFQEAQNYIPGGVNSPVRAFKAVGGDPLFIKSAKGAYLYDEDGNSYIDMINSWGPMILGHGKEEILDAISTTISSGISYGAPNASEVEMARIISEMIPSVEKVRMVNSGTEATMSAIRLARGYTGRDKFIKFEGCYHGHGDSFLIAAGSGAATMGTPDSPGVTKGTAKDTLLAAFNDLEQVKSLVENHKDEIAAIILEPVAGNMGCVTPEEGFLQGLRKICDENKILLIFDEVMTGFRLSPGGAQQLYGVTPDITTLGKIIGGGMPVGAYGGKKEIMDYISPQGPIYQAGTLSGNPVAMAAGLAMLNILQKDASTIYKQLEETTKEIVGRTRKLLDEKGLNYTLTQVGSMYSLFFTEKEVKNFEDSKTSDTGLFGKFFRSMLEEGVYLAPSQFEAVFVSTMIREKELETIENATRKAFDKLFS
ncbi:MAG: glutamate-1-semialdehyde 2,1-aminomutase [Candidatus Cyclobacteriaceae bacterium M2_1C_046]